MSTRPSGSISAQAATRTSFVPAMRGIPIMKAGRVNAVFKAIRSTAIGTVDADIAVRQIAGPNPRVAAAEAEIDADLRPRVPKRPWWRPPRRNAAARSPFSATTWPPNEMLQPVAIGRLARLADRHHHAAPIGVAAGDRRLHQRRIGDRQARCAAPTASVSAPVTSTWISFCAPSPSRTTCSARSSSTSSSLRRKSVRRLSFGLGDRRMLRALAGREEQAACRWSRCRCRP